MPNVTELLVIRHGETDWNRQQRFQGQIDVPLNALGHTQALRMAQALAHERWDALYTSDLTRVRETAAPLATAWGQQPMADAGLREQHFGAWEGLDVLAIKAQFGALWPQWIEHRGDFALPGGGESLLAFHQRVLSTVTRLAAAHVGQRIALVTHGGVLDMLWRSAKGLPIAGLRNCEIPNTGINRLTLATGGSPGHRHPQLSIQVWAQAQHLDGLQEQPSTAAGER